MAAVDYVPLQLIILNLLLLGLKHQLIESLTQLGKLRTQLVINLFQTIYLTVLKLLLSIIRVQMGWVTLLVAWDLHGVEGSSDASCIITKKVLSPSLICIRLSMLLLSSNIKLRLDARHELWALLSRRRYPLEEIGIVQEGVF